MTPRLHRALAVTFSLAAATLVSRGASAQTGDSASAEALFREGRALITSGDVAGACAKFRESNRLDPAVGTVFNIADCEEKLGHLAQAWTLFQEVVQRLPESDDRHAIAQRRAAALEPRLPHLRVRFAAGVPAGTRVERDGVELGSASLGSSLPVDPGNHRLTVSAPGHETREFSVALNEGEEKSVDVSPGPAAASTSSGGKSVPHPVDEPSGSGQKTLGYVIGGIGIAGLVTGAVAGVLVLGQKSTVDANCDENKRCNQEGLDAAERGKTLGVVTTVALAGGAVGLGVGTYLVLSAGSSGASGERSASARFVTSF
ncbi:MAG TPA: PEGA domain-containing protein [Polyangiaceae bacterium]